MAAFFWEAMPLLLASVMPRCQRNNCAATSLNPAHIHRPVVRNEQPLSRHHQMLRMRRMSMSRFSRPRRSLTIQVPHFFDIQRLTRTTANHGSPILAPSGCIELMPWNHAPVDKMASRYGQWLHRDPDIVSFLCFTRVKVVNLG